MHNALPVEHVVYQRLQLLKDCRGESRGCLYDHVRFRAGKFMSCTGFFYLHVTSVSDHMIQNAYARAPLNVLPGHPQRLKNADKW